MFRRGAVRMGREFVLLGGSPVCFMHALSPARDEPMREGDVPARFTNRT
jgi:hypothetical protein